MTTTDTTDELRNAILDIDAHATPFGTDDDGFVSGGYLISVGSLHRALGVVGHSAAKCGGCRNCWTLDQWKAEEQLLRDELEAQATRITELERWKAEALVVLGQWDEVWEALGRPGPLGSSKAVEALTEAHRLRATDPPADGPDPCPHCTPAAGSSSPDVAALAERLRDDGLQARHHVCPTAEVLVRAQFVDGEVWLVDDEGNEVGVMARSTFDRCVARPAAGSSSPDVTALAERLEQIAAYLEHHEDDAADLRAAAAQLRQLDRIKAAAGDARAVALAS